MPNRPFVLIGEDDELIQMVMERALEGAGFRVECVDDGGRLLERVGLNRPDVLVLDIFMPTVDGFEILRRIRADPGLAGLKVVICSALKRAEDYQMAQSLGAAGFVSKPFSPSDLVREIRGLVAGDRAA